MARALILADLHLYLTDAGVDARWRNGARRINGAARARFSNNRLRNGL